MTNKSVLSPEEIMPLLEAGMKGREEMASLNPPGKHEFCASAAEGLKLLAAQKTTGRGGRS